MHAWTDYASVALVAIAWIGSMIYALRGDPHVPDAPITKRRKH